MKKNLAICMMALVCALSTTRAATLCSGHSAPTFVDLTSGTRTAALTETIRYSTTWETSASVAESVISVNGNTLNVAPGNGTFAWQPTKSGTYTLTHRVLENGQQVGATLTAAFEFRLDDWIATPVITPADGTILDSTTNVIISCSTEGATIHYTTDGSEPTAASPIYRRFRVSGRTTVKAIAVKEGRCTEVVVAEYALGRCESPVVAAVASFAVSKTSVALSCATEGATIRYTLDGSDPGASATPYTGPFEVTNSCIVKAYATHEGFFDSTIASFSIEKIWRIGDTMGDPDRVFETGGDAPFVRVDDVTATLGESMQSGAITHSQTSMLSTAVSGPGTVSFQWKTSCEDSGGQYDWDHAEFEVDGDVVAYLDGERAWQTVSHEISGDGSHTLVWRYVKDDVESGGADCCWVADFHWTPAATPAYTETQTTPEPVPYSWLAEDAATILAAHGGDYEEAAKATAANGVNKVWECYVAGISPTNATARFEARLSMDEFGKPVVTWTPDLNEGGKKAERVYVVEGQERLGDGWGPTNAASKFFRVLVAMPEE